MYSMYEVKLTAIDSLRVMHKLCRHLRILTAWIIHSIISTCRALALPSTNPQSPTVSAFGNTFWCFSVEELTAADWSKLSCLERPNFRFQFPILLESCVRWRGMISLFFTSTNMQKCKNAKRQNVVTTPCSALSRCSVRRSQFFRDRSSRTPNEVPDALAGSSGSSDSLPFSVEREIRLEGVAHVQPVQERQTDFSNTASGNLQHGATSATSAINNHRMPNKSDPMPCLPRKPSYFKQWRGICAPFIMKVHPHGHCHHPSLILRSVILVINSFFLNSPSLMASKINNLRRASPPPPYPLFACSS